VTSTGTCTIPPAEHHRIQTSRRPGARCRSSSASTANQGLSIFAPGLPLVTADPCHRPPTPTARSRPTTNASWPPNTTPSSDPVHIRVEHEQRPWSGEKSPAGPRAERRRHLHPCQLLPQVGDSETQSERQTATATAIILAANRAGRRPAAMSHLPSCAGRQPSRAGCG